jgi:hypothetical protein
MASCIPQFGLLPMSPPFQGPPNWFDAAQYLWPGPNDPRWSGASGHGYSYGTGEDAEFRALYGPGPSATVPRYLYMTWTVNNDPLPDTNLDGVFVGFQRTGGPPLVLELTYPNAAAPDGTAAIATWHGCGATLPDGQHMPLTGTGLTPPNIRQAYWIRPPSGTNPSASWGISIRVPCLQGVAGDPDMSSDGINLGGIASGASFKFWYGIWIELPASNVAPFYWPRGAMFGADGAGNPAPPIASSWDDVQLGSGAGCGNGISMTYSDIGNNVNDPVTGNPAPTEVLVSLNAPIPTNHFFAKPLNGGPDPVVANAIEARFFTANWGSQSTWGNYQFVSGGDPAIDSPWEEAPFGKGAGVHYVNAAQIPSGSHGNITFDWQIPHNVAVEYLGDPSTVPPTMPTKFPHQCMLVTLANYVAPPNPQPPTPPPPASATGNDFINDSLYNNMDFVQASAFSARVMISTQGAPLAKGISSGAPTPLFIFAQQQNMARRLVPPRTLPTFKTLLRGSLAPIAIGGGDGLGARPDRVLQQTVATVKYHVFRSTGLRLRRRGRWHTLCDRQTSFGYHIEHEGPVFGWKHDFVHADARLGRQFPLKLAGGAFYQASIPGGDALQFNTSVVALVKKPPIIVRLTQPANIAPVAVKPVVTIPIVNRPVTTPIIAKPISVLGDVLNRFGIGG